MVQRPTALAHDFAVQHVLVAETAVQPVAVRVKELQLRLVGPICPVNRFVTMLRQVFRRLPGTCFGDAVYPGEPP